MMGMPRQSKAVLSELLMEASYCARQGCTANTRASGQVPAPFDTLLRVANVPVGASADGGYRGSGGACAAPSHGYAGESAVLRAGPKDHAYADDARHGHDRACA